MSLINEALKKAQAQRQSADGFSPSPPPPPPPGSSPPVVAGSAANQPGTGKLLLVLLILALLFVGGVGLLVWGLMRGQDKSANETAVAPPPSASSAPASLPTDRAQATESAAKPLPPIEFKMEEEAGVSEDSVSEMEKSEAGSGRNGSPQPSAGTAEIRGQSSGNSEEAKIPAETPPPESPPTPPTPSSSPPPSSENTLSAQPVPPPSGPRQTPPGVIADPAVEEFIAALEVRGVMSGGKKALIFDPVTQQSRAYSVGSTISNELQVKVEDISESSIAFIDNAGYIYTKPF